MSDHRHALPGALVWRGSTRDSRTHCRGVPAGEFQTSSLGLPARGWCVPVAMLCLTHVHARVTQDARHICGPSRAQHGRYASPECAPSRGRARAIKSALRVPLTATRKHAAPARLLGCMRAVCEGRVGKGGKHIAHEADP